MLNFEKFEGVGQFRPTPPSPEAGYPLVCLEPGQSLTEKKVRLITKNIVVEKRVISWGGKLGNSVPIINFEQTKLNCR